VLLRVASLAIVVVLLMVLEQAALVVKGFQKLHPAFGYHDGPGRLLPVSAELRCPDA